MAEQLPLSEELVSALARMSGLLLSQETVASALTVVTALAVEATDDAAGAGVTLVDQHGRKTTAAATDPVVGVADARQYELGEGPGAAQPHAHGHRRRRCADWISSRSRSCTACGTA